MSSRPSETPNPFHLEDDPFPHLRIRDALEVASKFVTTIIGEDTPTLNFHDETTLDHLMQRMPTLEIDEKNSLQFFFRNFRDRYISLCTKAMGAEYANFFTSIYLVSRYSRLQARYGNGTDQPSDDDISGKLDQIMMMVFRDQEEEYREKAKLIDDNDYETLLEHLYQERLDLLKANGRRATSLDEELVGLHFAYADAYWLLFLIRRFTRQTMDNATQNNLV